jgi:hypothetical protein
LHAIFGASEACIAVHPSDLAVALSALDVVVHTQGPAALGPPADMPAIDAFFVEVDDPYVNSLSAKGAGEPGITGVAAAVANAVYHATGKRIRSLPISPEMLL